MAGYRGHIAGGTVFTGIYIAVLSALAVLPPLVALGSGSIASTVAALLGVGVVFSLWPDVDTNSKGQDLFYGAAFIVDLVLILLGAYHLAAYFGLIALLPIVGKHRGWTHSFWAMIVVPLPFVIVPYLAGQDLWRPWLLYGAAVVGIFSHLWLDGLVRRRRR